MRKILIIVLMLIINIFGQSVNQKYSVKKNIIKTDNKIGHYNTIEYTVMQNDDKILYQIVDKVDYDIPFPKLQIFENGNSVLLNAFYGKLTFINGNGAKVKTLNIKKDIEVAYERNIISFVDNSSLIIAFTLQNEDNSVIQIYSDNGMLKNEFEISLININGIAFHEKLNKIFISSIVWNKHNVMEKRITVFNENGEVIKSLKSNFEKGFFTEDNKFIANTNKSLIVINANDSQIILKKEMNRESVLLDINYINKEILYAFAKTPTLANGKWFYENPTIISINEHGKLIDNKSVKIKKFSELTLSNYHNRLKVMIDNSIVSLD